MVLATVYDPLVRMLGAGREPALRRATLAAGGVSGGHDLLDVGCGTGALLVAAHEIAAPGARLVGLDRSAAMLAAARRRSDRAGAAVELVEGEATRLPFPDACFDVVFLSLVMHYLSLDQKLSAAGEARRVVRPGGTVVVVDFGRPDGAHGRLHALLLLHGRAAAAAPDLVALLSRAGLEQVARRPSPIGPLHIVRGVRGVP
jgi:ubiquinone/menaquinone biosynthesis C-methylase UbiE